MKRLSLVERIESKFMPEPNTGCWIWVGCRKKTGYGVINLRGRRTEAYRVVYELYNGAVPSGLELDHKCRVRACVNPDHLEPVTRRINCLRGVSFSAINAKKTHCINGHPLSGENLINRPDGHRGCLACGRAAAKRYRENRRGAA